MHTEQEFREKPQIRLEHFNFYIHIFNIFLQKKIINCSSGLNKLAFVSEEQLGKRKNRKSRSSQRKQKAMIC